VTIPNQERLLELIIKGEPSPKVLLDYYLIHSQVLLDSEGGRHTLTEFLAGCEEVNYFSAILSLVGLWNNKLFGATELVLASSGWQQTLVSELCFGDVVVYGKPCQSRRAGFYIGADQVITVAFELGIVALPHIHPCQGLYQEWQLVGGWRHNHLRQR
jgi:hypothetical protein